MNGLEFCASLVRSLAWPSAVVVIVIALRAQIAGLLTGQLIKSLKAGPGGLEIQYWDTKTEAVRLEIDAGSLALPRPEVEAPLPAVQLERDQYIEDIQSIARISPTAAVLEAHRQFERYLASELARVIQDPKRPPTLGSLAQEAVRVGLLTDSDASVLRNLTELRNAAAHEGAAIDEARAIEYALLARELMLTVNRRAAIGKLSGQL